MVTCDRGQTETETACDLLSWVLSSYGSLLGSPGRKGRRDLHPPLPSVNILVGQAPLPSKGHVDSYTELIACGSQPHPGGLRQTFFFLSPATLSLAVSSFSSRDLLSHLFFGGSQQLLFIPCLKSTSLSQGSLFLGWPGSPPLLPLPGSLGSGLPLYWGEGPGLLPFVGT